MSSADALVPPAPLLTMETAFGKLRKEYDDLLVQCKFWRQAAEQAIHAWNALEDEYEYVNDCLRKATLNLPTGEE